MALSIKNLVRFLIYQFYFFRTAFQLDSTKQPKDEELNLISNTKIISEFKHKKFSFNNDLEFLIDNLIQQVSDDTACKNLKEEITNLKIDSFSQNKILSVLSDLLNSNDDSSPCDNHRIQNLIQKVVHTFPILTTSYKYKVGVGVISSLNLNKNIEKLDINNPLTDNQMISNFFSKDYNLQLDQEKALSQANYFNYQLFFNKQFNSTMTFEKSQVENFIKQLFINQRNLKNNKIFNSTVLFLLSDQCGTNSSNPSIFFTDSNTTFEITYTDIINSFRMFNNFYFEKYELLTLNKKFFMILDCPNSDLWVNKCKNDYDCKEITILSLSSKKKFLFKNGASLFLTKFLHNQNNDKFSKEIFKPINTIQNEVLHEINGVSSDSSICGFPLIASFYTGLNFISSEQELFTYSRKNYNIKITDENLIVGEYNYFENNFKGLINFYSNENLYLGFYYENKKNGDGLELTRVNAKEGTFKNEELKHGIIYNNNNTLHGKSIFEGRFENENIVDFGRLISLTNGFTYQGYFNEGAITGKGEMYNFEGNKLEGNFLNGKLNGNGMISYYKKAYVLKGLFSDGKISNEKPAMVQFFSGHRLKANFTEEKMEGRVIILYSNGTYFDGNVEKNIRKGEGHILGNDGEIILKTNFDDTISLFDIFLNEYQAIEVNKRKSEIEKDNENVDESKNVHYLEEQKKIGNMDSIADIEWYKIQKNQKNIEKDELKPQNPSKSGDL